MAVNHPSAGKQPPPLVKKLISGVVGAPANKPGQQSKPPLKGLDSLVTLLPTKEATKETPPVDEPVAEPERRQPLRSVGECEATYQSMVDLDLLNRNIDTEATREAVKAHLEAEPPAAAEESAELAELHRRDDAITAETHARIYGGTEVLNISKDTTAKELELLSSILEHPTTHHVYSSKHHLNENETDMTQQEQTQEQGGQYKQIGPFLNAYGHEAACKHFTEEVIAKLDSGLKNYGPMSPHGSVENYGQFKEDLITKNLEGRVAAYLARYCSTIAFIELAEKIDQSSLYRTAITGGIRAIDLGRNFENYASSSEVASANSVRCAWDVVDAIAYASAVTNAANRWLFSADPSGFTQLDVSELLLSKGVHTVVNEQRHSDNYLDNTVSYNRTRLKEMKSVEHATKLMMELVEITENLLNEAEALREDENFGNRGGQNAISELQNAVSVGISLLSDAISFMTTSYPRYNGRSNGHYWLTNQNANIHMCVMVDENYLVTVELNLYIREDLKTAIAEQDALFDEALMAYLPGDVAINTSIMANLKKVMMDSYIAGRQSAATAAPKPVFGFDPGYRQLMGVAADQPLPTQKDLAGVSAMREGLKCLREGAFNPGEDALNQGNINLQLQGGKAT